MPREPGRSHMEMAVEIFAAIRDADQHSPLADGGSLYRYAESGLWVPHDLDDLARLVGSSLNEVNCKRGGDYRSIAGLVYAQARNGLPRDASPFDDAPPQMRWKDRTSRQAC